MDKNENGELSNLFTAQINWSRKNMLTFWNMRNQTSEISAKRLYHGSDPPQQVGIPSLQ